MAAKTGICRLCLQEKPLIKSHVIPECFQNSLKSDRNRMVVIHLNQKNQVQTVEDFMFDKTILCAICDNSFSPSEKYTARFLDDVKAGKIKPHKKQHTEKGNTDLHFNADTAKIKNCLLSILWRMSISNHKLFKGVNLEESENILRQALNSDKLTDPQFFPFAIFSLKNVNNLKVNGLCPVGQKLNYRGIVTYVFHVPEYLIFYYAQSKIPVSANLSAIRGENEIVIALENGTYSTMYLERIYSTLPDNPRF